MPKSVIILLTILNAMFSAVGLGWIIIGSRTDIPTWFMTGICLSAVGLGINEIRKAESE